MLKNIVVSAWRNLKRHRGYAFVSVVGLGLGLAPALFVALFLRFELSYDRHVPDYGRVFRVIKPGFRVNLCGKVCGKSVARSP